MITMPDSIRVLRDIQHARVPPVLRPTHRSLLNTHIQNVEAREKSLVDALATIADSTGGRDVLKLGRYKVASGILLEFDIQTGWPFLSTPTKTNLEKFRKLWQANYTSVILNPLVQHGNYTQCTIVFGAYIKGTLNDLPFIYARKETISKGAGQTKLYFPEYWTAATGAINTEGIAEFTALLARMGVELTGRQNAAVIGELL